jgi:hypothetical protein
MLAFVVSCAKAPQEAIDAANAALQAAKTVEADRYAAAEYNAAKDSLDAATAEVEKQNSKFALFRNYGDASRMLQSAVNAANAAAAAAATNKEQVKVEAEQLVSQAQAAVAEVKKLMARAPRGKEGRAALELIQSDVNAVETQLSEAGAAMTSGDFLTARDKSKAALDKLNSIKDELMQAIGKKKMMTTQS